MSRRWGGGAGAARRERYGLYADIVTGVVGTTVGAWLRYASCFVPITDSNPYGRYALALAGQCVAGLAQPCFVNAPSKLAGKWCVRARARCTVMGVLC